MTDQHMDIPTDGGPITFNGRQWLTRDDVRAETHAHTQLHPPIPGLRWQLSFGQAEDGQPEVRDRQLIVDPAWHDAYAPPFTEHPPSPEQRRLTISHDDQNRLGALAYTGWRAVLPDIVKQAEAPWHRLPEHFRGPMTSAAVTVWQHGANHGYTDALERTLPSARLGAAGELENLRDGILARLHHHACSGASAADILDQVLNMLTERVAVLRQPTEGRSR